MATATSTTSAPTNGTGPAPAFHWVPMNIGGILSLPPKQWLIDQVLGVGDMGVLYAPAGTGKSFVALDLGYTLALGRAWAGGWDLAGSWAGGFAVARPYVVFYCTGEGVSGLSNRMRALVDYHQAQPPGFYAFPDVPQLGQKFNPSVLGLPAFTNDLHAQITAGAIPSPDLVIIDTLATATTGVSENDPAEQNAALNSLRGTMRQLNCATLLIHHTSKLGIDERGSTALRGTADTMVAIRANGEHTIECTKVKDAVAFTPQRFELKPWQGSCVIRWDGEAASATTKGTGKAPTIADKVYELLLKYPLRQFTAKELAAGVGAGEGATTNALQRLKDAGKAEQSAAPAGSKATWIWQLSSALRAVTPP